MRKLISAAILAGGIAAFGVGRYQFNDKFSTENVWTRQRSLIELKSGQHVKDRYYRELEKGLKKVENSSRRDKCAFEKRFALILHYDSEEAADLEAKRRSFKPHADCSTFNQIKKDIREWHVLLALGGIGAFLFGLGSLILGIKESLHRRRMARERQAARAVSARRHGFRDEDPFAFQGPGQEHFISEESEEEGPLE
jgi:hypothetical protein